MKLNEKIDICSISELALGWNKKNLYYEESIVKVSEYVIKFSRIHKNIAFVGKRLRLVANN